MKIDAGQMPFQELNQRLRSAEDDRIRIENCLGQRYIASGSKGKKLEIHGTPGNALGAYLDGSEITVYGNVQEATGDTMNEGTITVHGSAGDATGYAMRGGRIFVKGDTGYRAGIHMKAYRDKIPMLVVGGRAGSFLGEYQAGGVIIVLGLHCGQKVPVGNFCGTGMHGGAIYLRCEELPPDLPPQVVAYPCGERELAAIRQPLQEFCSLFQESFDQVIGKSFYLLKPDTKNPYKQLYTQN